VKANNEALRSDAEMFFEMTNDLMIVVDFDGNVLRINNAWSKKFGFSTEQLLEHNVSQTLNEEQHIISREFYDQLLTGRTKSLDYTAQMQNRLGNNYIVVWNMVCNFEEHRIYGIGRDMTESVDLMNKMRDNEERFKFLSNNNLEAVLVSVEGKIELYNKAFTTLSGYSSEELDEMDDRHLIVEEDRTLMLQRVANRSEDTYLSRLQRRDGTTTNIEVIPSNIIYKGRNARLVLIRNLDSAKEREAARLEIENRFNALFHNSAFGIVVMDLEGRILNANDLIIKSLGYDKPEITQLSIKDLVYKEDFSKSIESFQALIDGSSVTSTTEERLVAKNGKKIWIRSACSKVEISPGQEVVMALLEDIDEEIRNRNELGEIERRFETVFNSSPTGIVISKNEGEIIHCNPAFAQMMGYSEEELLHTNILDYTHSDDREVSEKMQSLLNRNKVQDYDLEKRYLKKNGKTIWTKIWVSLIERKGKDIYKVSMIENIDNRKSSERKIEQKNKELTQINQVLEYFAYVASHDLQEPLRTIASFIQILDKRYSEQLDEDGKQFMGFVVDGAKRMQLLIRDLLEYSRVNRFNTEYEKVDLNDVFETVNRVLKQKIDSTDTVILAENLPEIQGNKIQLTQVFQNLVDNAIKFRGPNKPEITITVEEQNTKWLISVKDNGIGISAEYYKRIFIIFQRLHTHEEYSGTGIGLALCKKIIERHGGEIWVDSQKDNGTQFSFTIKKNLIRAVS
jgi:PAS domain S-box-containing protein